MRSPGSRCSKMSAAAAPTATPLSRVVSGGRRAARRLVGVDRKPSGVTAATKDTGRVALRDPPRGYAVLLLEHTRVELALAHERRQQEPGAGDGLRGCRDERLLVRPVD